MAYIRLPGGIRVAMEYEVFGKLVVNVYHITTVDPIVTVKLLDIAQIFKLWWDGSMSGALSVDIALAKVTALDLDVPNGEKVTLVVSPVIPGQSADPAVSNQVAIVASFATAKTGRSFRGRSYQAGLTENTVEANNIPTATAAFLVSVYADLVIDLATEDAVLVVASFQSGGIPREEGVATEIDSISINTRVDTQRRRLPA